VDLRVFVIAPGRTQNFDPAAWGDAVVVVERGQVVLESLDGRRVRCERGFVGFLAGLPLRAVHNERQDLALISAVSRAPHRVRPRPVRGRVISFPGSHRLDEGRQTKEGIS
jgi:hypothetical protein